MPSVKGSTSQPTGMTTPEGHQQGPKPPEVKSRIPRPVDQKPEHRRLDQRSVRPHNEGVQQNNKPRLQFHPMARMAVTAPEHYQASGKIPAQLNVTVPPGTTNIESFVRKNLGVPEDIDHLQFTLLKNGQGASVEQLKAGGIFELTIESDPDVVTALGDLIEVGYQPKANYQPVPFSERYRKNDLESLSDQIGAVNGGQCPAGIIDISSPWVEGLDLVALSPDLSAEIVPSDTEGGLQLVFWRADSDAAYIAVEKYKAQQEALVRQAQQELYLGTPVEQVKDNQKILQLQARKRLVGGDQSWDRELERLSKADIQKRSLPVQDATITTEERLEAFGQKPEERVVDGRSLKQCVDNHADLLSIPDRKKLEQSGFLGQKLPEKIDELLAPWHKRLERPMPKTRYGIEARVKELSAQMEKINDSFSSWSDQQKNLSILEKIELRAVRDSLRRERNLLLQVMNDPGAVGCANNGMSWNQAMEFKRLGYQLQPDVTRLSKLNDQQLDPKSPPTKLGSGGINTVYHMNYLTPEGDKVVRVFKPIATRDDTRWSEIVGEDRYLNPDCPFFTMRNMAAEKTSTALGFVDLVPDIEFVEHKQQMGLVMTMASGLTGYDAVKQNKIHTMDRDLYWQMCSELNRLEWLDALCAQPDRHTCNYMIDPETGQVIGIDNDVGFSPNPDIVRESEDKSSSDKYSGGARTGFPLLIDQAVLEGLRSLDIDALVVELEPLLSREELAALKERYVKLLEHAEGLAESGLCVEDWETWEDPTLNMAADQYQLEAQRSAEAFTTMYEDDAEYWKDELTKSGWTDSEKEQLQARYTTMDNLAQSMKVAKEHSYLGRLLSH
ncbi:hypothetical protein [Parendozoicomonas haliclonae]|uniref:Uncharacterized protein n=1 Tax=Parendozoicomonas haliclonae TaxID=1960125 RepID=A0A1X7AP74_9GAMM|nr:hypothetical protein [Parendozoicomonas haliclonae]SMA50121.1 hypothetical protein EHSB41UT_03912 [Parendozoicomonas haliclonae]